MSTEIGHMHVDLGLDASSMSRGVGGVITILNQLQKSLDAAAVSTDGLDKAVAATPRSFNTMSKATKEYEKEMGRARAANVNLISQFNDIGVMLAAGQNPLQLALQQGTQVSQVLSSVGSGTGALKAVGSAFVGLLNPMSLATIGFIAIGSALAQKFLPKIKEAIGFTGTLEDKLKNLKTATEEMNSAVDKAKTPVAELAKEWGDVALQMQKANENAASAAVANQSMAAIAAAEKHKKDTTFSVSDEGYFDAVDNSQGNGRVVYKENYMDNEAKKIQDEFGATEAQALRIIELRKKMHETPVGSKEYIDLLVEEQNLLRNTIEYGNYTNTITTKQRENANEAIKKSYAVQEGLSKRHIAVKNEEFETEKKIYDSKIKYGEEYKAKLINKGASQAEIDEADAYIAKFKQLKTELIADQKEFNSSQDVTIQKHKDQQYEIDATKELIERNTIEMNKAMAEGDVARAASFSAAIDQSKSDLAELEAESKTATENMAKNFKELGEAVEGSFDYYDNRMKNMGLPYQAEMDAAAASTDPEKQRELFEQRKASGGGGRDAEIVAAATMVAQAIGAQVVDVLALWSFETGGTFSPGQWGGVDGKHLGLIQFGPEQQKQYGVNENQTIYEQALSVIDYYKDPSRKWKPGMTRANLYATVLGGNALAVNANDTKKGGVVSDVSEAVYGQQWKPHLAKAQGLVGAHGDTVSFETQQYNEREKAAADAAQEEERLAKERQAAAEKAAEDVKEYADGLATSVAYQEKESQMLKWKQEQLAAINSSNLSEDEKAAAIARVNAEIERQLAITKLEEDAKRRGVDLNAKMVNSNLTYAEAIKQLTDAKYQDAISSEQFAQAQEKVNQRQEFWNGQIQNFKDGVVQAAMAGEGLADVLKNIAAALAEALLQSALWGQGPLANGHGGLLGGLMNLGGGLLGGGDPLAKALGGAGVGAIPIAGAYAAGGTVSANGWQLVGEKGSELINMNRGSQVMNNQNTQKLLRGMGEGGSGTTVRIDLSPDLEARIVDKNRQNSVQITKNGIGQYDKRGVNRAVDRYTNDPHKR